MIRKAGLTFVAMAMLALFAPAREATAQEGSRILTGEVRGPKHDFLPKRAVLIVEALERTGSHIATFREPIEVRQPPWGFSIAAPEGGRGVLRAAILDGLRTRWISQTDDFEADASGAMRAPLRLSPVPATGFAQRLRCGAQDVLLFAGPDRARMRVGQRWHDLAPSPAASGARYEAVGDADTFAWTRAGSALIAVGGAQLAECAPAITPLPFPMTVTGLDRRMTIMPGLVSLSDRNSEDYWRVDLATLDPIRDGARLDVPEANLRADITERVCRDAESGMPHPHSVTVTYQGKTQTGCGGDPRELLAGDWTVVKGAGAGMTDVAPARMTITPLGTIAGFDGCNRFTGQVSVAGTRMMIRPRAATKMACTEKAMTSARSFLTWLGASDRFDIDEDGALSLIGRDRVTMRLR
ncbi:MAG: META domain-containing protein [Rhodobacteraceae bacterium]|jgi:heat shock protein HslJ|nr:META domain-containing protein [Paracoccaceae bacterium]